MHRARVIKQLIINHLEAVQAHVFDQRLAANVITELEIKPGKKTSLQQFVEARLMREALTYIDNEEHQALMSLIKKISYYIEDGMLPRHYFSSLKDLGNQLHLEISQEEPDEATAQDIRLEILRWLLLQLN